MCICSSAEHRTSLSRSAAAAAAQGKIAAARAFAQKGCEACPQSEDVWLEAAWLQTPENAKAVLARGVEAIPTSVKLWLQAAQLEQARARRRP